MRKKITKNKQFLVILLGLCSCILLQGFITSSLRPSVWDNENSSISQFLDLNDEDPSIPAFLNLFTKAALLKSFLYSSTSILYTSNTPQITHGRSPPAVV